MYLKVCVCCILVVFRACFACFVSSLLVFSAAGLSVGENISGICCNSIQRGKHRVGCRRFLLGLRAN